MRVNKEKVLSEFFSDIDDICKEYNLSIALEDVQGSFIIEDYSVHNMKWLKEANYEQR